MLFWEGVEPLLYIEVLPDVWDSQPISEAEPAIYINTENLF